MTYLVRSSLRRRGPGSVLSAEDLRVTFARRWAVKRDLGFATEVEDAGVDRGKFDIRPVDPRNGNGTEASRRAAERECEATARAVRANLRRIRPQEAAQIAAFDERIFSLRRQIELLGAERDEALRRAFSKGHVVTLAELRAIAERAEATRRGNKRPD